MSFMLTVGENFLNFLVGFFPLLGYIFARGTIFNRKSYVSYCIFLFALSVSIFVFQPSFLYDFDYPTALAFYPIFMIFFADLFYRKTRNSNYAIGMSLIIGFFLTEFHEFQFWTLQDIGLGLTMFPGWNWYFTVSWFTPLANIYALISLGIAFKLGNLKKSTIPLFFIVYLGLFVFVFLPNDFTPWTSANILFLVIRRLYAFICIYIIFRNGG